MLKFGLACEGATDQAALENILCGFYNNKDLRNEIKAFQPLFDATKQKQLEGEFGGWEILLKFISTKRFRQEVINNQYMIIQIDTDISEHKNFNVMQHNLSTEELIEKVIRRLIYQIDFNKLPGKLKRLKWSIVSNKSTLANFKYQYNQFCKKSNNSFYKKHKKKIIFAISVHSLECWLLPLYKSYKNEKITGCIQAMEPKTNSKSFTESYKNYQNYLKLSQPFLKQKTLSKISSQNKSFNIFISKLPTLT